MAALSTLTSTTAGVVFATASAAGGGDTFTNTGSELFYIANGGGGSITVTFDVTGTIGRSGEPGTDRAVAVANGATKIIGPFDPAAFGGTVSVTYSGVTSVTVAVIRAALP